MDSTMIFVSGVVHVSDSSSAFSTAATFLAKYALRSKSFASSAGDATLGSARTLRTTGDRAWRNAGAGPTRDVATPKSDAKRQARTGKYRDIIDVWVASIGKASAASPRL
jgi:hypothetical protein